MRAIQAAIFGFVFAGAIPAAHALQATASYETRVVIGNSCSITVSDLDFGMVGTIGTHTATASVQVNCSSGTPYQLSFSNVAPVTNYAGTMTSGANTIAYSAALSGSGGTGPGTLSIMGLILPQPTPPDGIYSDNRTVYLNY
jgi:spore coat protein U-like protein